ncbi:efflux transporter, RND family, MFP subunit [Gloeomargarita lithophora Alchichica-D10]|uniref:Efflux transporter, RND family, MFP subunit n=1 Tax=Gloeomargarita lithophora Alchichica-D10 TaxID=1188229 RepID=A0A1J0AEJ4_9CYAN|nr:efflux RND transporter periplasmic adaptor subunit [Gloeomargarita lithophora]APB34335.1 efflux transporter, RND family, MFP subunit [Gloeomargarita lithophora Alchichica-D10]
MASPRRWLNYGLWLLPGAGILWALTLWWRPAPPNTGKKAPPPRPVEVTEIQTGTGITRNTLLGQVEALTQATIRAQTSGLVKEMLVQPGDQVRAGQTLVVLDNRDQNIALAQAQARLAEERSALARLEVGTRPEIIAQRQAELKAAQAREREAQDRLDRNSQLVKEGAIAERTLVEARAALEDARSQRLRAQAALAEAQAGATREERDTQRARVATAQASVQQLELQNQRTRITALSNGSVRTCAVSVGSLVQSDDPVVTLVDANELDIYLELTEILAGQIRPGQMVTLTSRSLPGWQTTAPISAVIPATDPSSRRQQARLRLNNPPAGLLPGMAVQAELQSSNNVAGLVIPRDALTRRNQEWLVFMIQAGDPPQAQALPVELVTDMGTQVLIRHPELRPGQKIVLRGGDGLRDQAPVKIVNPPG